MRNPCAANFRRRMIAAQPLFGRVRARDWCDWRWQMSHSVTDPGRLPAWAGIPAAARAAAIRAAALYPVRITPYYLSLARWDDAADPVLMQCLAAPQELQAWHIALADPLDLDLTTEQATCVAKRWIDALDPDELRKSDVTPGDLDDAGGADAALEDADEEQAGRLFAAYDPCEVDVRAEFMRRVQADLTTADATCLEEGISDDMVRKVAVDEMIDAHDAAVTTELFEALASCSGPGPEP